MHAALECLTQRVLASSNSTAQGGMQLHGKVCVVLEAASPFSKRSTPCPRHHPAEHGPKFWNPQGCTTTSRTPGSTDSPYHLPTAAAFDSEQLCRCPGQCLPTCQLQWHCVMQTPPSRPPSLHGVAHPVPFCWLFHGCRASATWLMSTFPAMTLPVMARPSAKCAALLMPLQRRASRTPGMLADS